MLAVVTATLFPSLMIMAAAGDVLSRRIPNRLVLLIAAFFFPLAWAHGMPAASILTHSGIGLALLIAGFALFSLGFLGGGDAKLLGAAGLWFGLAGLPQFLLMTVLAGGVLGLAVGAWSMVMLQVEFKRSDLAQRLAWLRPSVPYGYAIAAGAILSMPGSWLVQSPAPSTWLTQI